MSKSKKFSIKERFRLLKFWKHMTFERITYGLKYGYLNSEELREILRKLEKKESKTK